MRLDQLSSYREVEQLQWLDLPVDPCGKVVCLGSSRLDPLSPVDIYKKGKLLDNQGLALTLL